MEDDVVGQSKRELDRLAEAYVTDRHFGDELKGDDWGLRCPLAIIEFLLMCIATSNRWRNGDPIAVSAYSVLKQHLELNARLASTENRGSSEFPSFKVSKVAQAARERGGAPVAGPRFWDAATAIMVRAYQAEVRGGGRSQFNFWNGEMQLIVSDDLLNFLQAVSSEHTSAEGSFVARFLFESRTWLAEYSAGDDAT